MVVFKDNKISLVEGELFEGEISNGFFYLHNILGKESENSALTEKSLSNLIEELTEVRYKLADNKLRQDIDQKISQSVINVNCGKCECYINKVKDEVFEYFSKKKSRKMR